MSDDVSDLIERLLEMTQMTDEEKERMKQVFNMLQELRKLDQGDDLSDANVDISELDIESMEDLDDILGKLDDLPIDEIGGFKIDDLDASDITEYFDSTSDYLYEPEKTDVEIEEPDDKMYHGENWLQVGDGYETFTEIPDDISKGDIEISLTSEFVEIHDPISEKISVKELPENDLDDLQVTKKGNRLLLRLE